MKKKPKGTGFVHKSFPIVARCVVEDALDNDNLRSLIGYRVPWSTIIALRYLGCNVEENGDVWTVPEKFKNPV